jgi:hypothetical protein
MCTPFPYRGPDSGARAGWGNVPSVPGGSGNTRGHYEPCGISQASGSPAFHAPAGIGRKMGLSSLQERAVPRGFQAPKGPARRMQPKSTPEFQNRRASEPRLRVAMCLQHPREATGSSIPSTFFPETQAMR